MGSLFGNTIIQTAREETSLDRSINTIIKDSYNVDLNAFYRAIVVNNKDPLLLGRVQVRIPSIHGTSNTRIQTPAQALPWAFPGTWSCTGNDMGQYLVPEEGTVVFVTFESKDATKPIYFGGVSSQIGNTTKYIMNPSDVNKGESYKVNTNDYPEGLSSIHNKMLFKSVKGSEIVTSDSDGDEFLYLIDASGQSIEMENFGPYLKRRGNKLGFSGKPRMRLSTNRGSDLTITNESEIVTTREFTGQLDNFNILNKTCDLSGLDYSLTKLLNDRFRDFGNYGYNKEDKVFNLDIKTNDIIGLDINTEKVYNYPIKVFEEIEYDRGLFLQVSFVERNENNVTALITYRNNTLNNVELGESISLYFRKDTNLIKVDFIFDSPVIAYKNSENNFYANASYTNIDDLYSCDDISSYDYRLEFRFIVDTLKIEPNDIFSLDFTGVVDTWVGYIKSIDWGDSTVNTYTEPQSVYTHDYGRADSFLVKVYYSDINFKMPVGLSSKGIVSIEGPIPYRGNIPVASDFGSYYLDNTLNHINKYIFRNYTLLKDTLSTISMNSVFAGCVSLESIPKGIFDTLSPIDSLESAFEYCGSLKEIPDGLFDNIDLTRLSNISRMFLGCSSLETLPDYIFGTNFLDLITDVSYMFFDSGIIKIPKGLFANMPNIANAMDVFENCKGLSYIPEDLFRYNQELVYCDCCFKGSGISEIPSTLFRYNKNIKSLQWVFALCENISTVPSDLFRGLSALTDLRDSFKGSGIESIQNKGMGLISSIRKPYGSYLYLNSMFQDCIHLKLNKGDLFDENIDLVNVTLGLADFLNRGFYIAEGKSYIDPLWSLPNIYSYNHAFYGYGNSDNTIINYSSIPQSWR